MCMCAYAHNVFMDVIIQPSSKILFFSLYRAHQFCLPGAKAKDPVVLKAWGLVWCSLEELQSIER